MRIATKYPRIAERHFEDTGRQAEVIEVKGSVELAPLVGLADGIVDLVDTGRTLAENDLEVREEIAVCTARLVANRVAHKLRAAEIDALAGAPAGGDAMRLERIEWDGADADGARAPRSAGAGAGARATSAETVAEIVARVARRRRRGAARALDRASARPRRSELRVDPERIAAAPGAARRRPSARRCGPPRPTSARSPSAELERLDRPGDASSSSRASGSRSRATPGRLGRRLRARRARRLPVVGADVRAAGAGRRRAADRRRLAAGRRRAGPTDAVLAACALAGVDEVYAVGGAAGDRRARLRHRDDRRRST